MPNSPVQSINDVLQMGRKIIAASKSVFHASVWLMFGMMKMFIHKTGKWLSPKSITINHRDWHSNLLATQGVIHFHPIIHPQDNPPIYPKCDRITVYGYKIINNRKLHLKIAMSKKSQKQLKTITLPKIQLRIRDKKDDINPLNILHY
jgi:hypothetical protein